MLHQDTTVGVIVYGVQLDLSGLSEGDYVAFDARVRSVRGVTHVVPGDTVYVDHDIWSKDTILGVTAAIVETYEAPSPFSLDQASRARSSFDALATKLRALGEPLVDAALERAPALYLTSCGPLPFAQLGLGVTIPSDQRGQALHTFQSSQDMDQAWLPEGVDGASIASAEFFDVAELELTAESVGKLGATLSGIQNPRLYISVRYD